MNPATPGLTVLLIAPPGDTALLADEAGGVVPKMRRVYVDRMVDGYLASVPAWVGTRGKGDGLLLVHNGAPVAMGCDRAARWSNHPLIARLDEETALMIARLCARNRDARVVLLRDGREVES